jgi:hypothetical protein
VSLCRSNYHQWVGYVESVATFREGDGGYRVLTPNIPVLSRQVSMGQVSRNKAVSNLDRLIPTPRDDNLTTGGVDVFDHADGGIMFCYLSGLTGLNIVHSACVVGSC